MRFSLFLALGFLIANPLDSHAQMTQDGTTGTQLEMGSDRVTVNGGDRDGGNLFHSFRQFSVPTGFTVQFENPADVANIINRVTGGSLSDIDGVISANGSANFILINPAGIRFGENAKLDIGGSLLATTAERLVFADGNFFDATDTQGKPILTVTAPIGLQFGNIPGSITNLASQGLFNGSIPAGLEVSEGKGIALVGGDVFMSGGTLAAPAGRIEVGGVAGGSLITLVPDSMGWALDYSSGVMEYKDVELLNESRLITSLDFTEIDSFANLPSSGLITVRGQNIKLENNSEILAFNDGTEVGGQLTISAVDTLSMVQSAITTNTFTQGDAGSITLEARQLILRDDSVILAGTIGTGNAGNILLSVSAFLELSGESQIGTETFSTGNAGAIAIETDRLVLSNGGRLSNDTLASGNGGAIAISANSIEISGIGPSSIPSSISTGSLRANPNVPAPTGNGGSVDIESDRLTLTDSGTISVASEGEGAAGNISIAADVLRVEGGGTMNASTRSPGAAQGNIALDVGNILLIQEGAIATESLDLAGSGNIELSLGSGALALGVENIEPNGGVLTIAGQQEAGLQAEEVDLGFVDIDSLISQGGCPFRSGREVASSFRIFKGGDTTIMTISPLEERGGSQEATSVSGATSISEAA